MPEDNDILYTQYGPDLLGIIERLFETITGNGDAYQSVISFLATFWHVYSIIAFLLSALFIYGIIYSYIRQNQLSITEAESMADEDRLWKELHGSTQENRQWSEIESHLASGNPNDWKLAIIEANIILGEILKKAGYAGQTIGDQLKSASASNFATLQDAWDAHRIRNRIAHEGADFVLTQVAAKEAMVKYQRVFREFDVV